MLDEIADYNYSSIKKCIYIKGKVLKISNNEFNDILSQIKISFLNYLNNNTDNSIDGISYNRWCKEKLKLIKKDDVELNLKIGAICWIDLGYNIGNELRKLRPAILWKSSANKKMWTVIPLTSKRRNDNYYFHYDLENKNLGTARIENLITISHKRIKEPYFIKNKISTITKKDNDNILKIIKKYYAFDKTNIIVNSKRDNILEKHEKVLT